LASTEKIKDGRKNP